MSELPDISELFSSMKRPEPTEADKEVQEAAREALLKVLRVTVLRDLSQLIDPDLVRALHQVSRGIV